MCKKVSLRVMHNEYLQCEPLFGMKYKLQIPMRYSLITQSYIDCYPQTKPSLLLNSRRNSVQSSGQPDVHRLLQQRSHRRLRGHRCAQRQRVLRTLQSHSAANAARTQRPDAASWPVASAALRCRFFATVSSNNWGTGGNVFFSDR